MTKKKTITQADVLPSAKGILVLPSKVPNVYDSAFAQNMGFKLELWTQNPENLWLGNFAAENGLPRQRLYELAQRYPEEFGKIWEYAKSVQENRLVERGLKVNNPAFIIFTLKNVCKWRDDHTKAGADVKNDLRDIIVNIVSVKQPLVNEKNEDPRIRVNAREVYRTSGKQEVEAQ